MRALGARAIAYAVVALMAWGAVHVIRPIPERRPADLLDGARHEWEEVADTLAGGETLSELLGRAGLGGAQVTDLLVAADSLDARRMPAGMRVTFGRRAGDSIPSNVVLHLTPDRLLRLTRGDAGWEAHEERLPWIVDTMVVRARVATNLYDALDSAGTSLTPAARSELAWEVADIFEYRVDMSRDLQAGDVFAVLVERKRGPEAAVRVGRVLAATFASGGGTLRAIRHEENDRAHYYDQDGKSMEAGFLRAPLQFRRISSVYGMRRHPILGIWRAHRGTDYSAAGGTPVRSIGDGVVVFAGRRGGYGNVIDVRHANGYVSRYGHLRGFARGLRSGRRVAMGETIGFVGSTGLATAPHLHFELLVGGVQKNPRTTLASKSGVPLPASERERFQSTKDRYLAVLEPRVP